MARRNDHSREQLHQLALSATLGIIAEQGLAGVSMRKVAAVMGYSAGSLYSVFTNLDDLLLQANRLTLEQLSAHLSRVESYPQAEAQIQALAQAYWEFAQQYPLLWRAIFEHIPVTYSAPDWHQQQISQLFRQIEAPLARLMPAQSPEQVAYAARALWSGVQGICFLAMTDKLAVVNAPTTESLLRFLVQTFLAGLAQTAPEIVQTGDCKT